MHKHILRSTAVPTPNVSMTQTEKKAKVSMRKFLVRAFYMALHADAMHFSYSSITVHQYSTVAILSLID